MKYGLGWKRQKLDHRDLQYNAVPINIRKPVDLRPKMPPIYDQGQTGSCVANATAAAFQYARMSQSLANWTPSRLFIYWNTRDLEGTTDEDAGSENRDAIKSVANIGVCPETEWQFSAAMVTAKPSDRAYALATHAKAIQYAAVRNSLESILSCLNHNGPVIFGSSVFAGIQSEEAEKTGYIPMPTNTERAMGGHAMMIVGWLPDTHRFIIRNSWGAGWGMSGYGTMDRDYILNRGLTDDLWTIWLTSRN